MTEIAILDDYQNVALQMAAWDQLNSASNITVFNDTIGADQHDALVSRLHPFEIICAMRERTPFPEELLARLPNLRLLNTSGMKNAAIDVVAAQRHGILVCGTRSPGHATAELTWGLILALLRRIPQQDRALRSGAWQSGLGSDVHGKTLGLLGLGRLGAQVATVGRAFGMEVLAWSQNLTAERTNELGVEQAKSKQDLLRRADVVSIHLRLSERTRGLLGKEEFGLMKNSAYLVNTSRAPIVDQLALHAALMEQKIAGAGLDVYEHEPLPPGYALAALDNVVLTPHIGYVTVETYQQFFADMVENIVAFAKHEPMRVMTP